MRGREEGGPQTGEERKCIALRTEHRQKSLSTSPARRNRFKLKVLHLLHPLVDRTLTSKQSRQQSCNSSLLPLEVVYIALQENEISLSETPKCALSDHSLMKNC